MRSLFAVALFLLAAPAGAHEFEVTLKNGTGTVELGRQHRIQLQDGREIHVTIEEASPRGLTFFVEDVGQTVALDDIVAVSPSDAPPPAVSTSEYWTWGHGERRVQTRRIPIGASCPAAFHLWASRLAGSPFTFAPQIAIEPVDPIRGELPAGPIVVGSATLDFGWGAPAKIPPDDLRKALKKKAITVGGKRCKLSDESMTAIKGFLEAAPAWLSALPDSAPPDATIEISIP